MSDIDKLKKEVKFNKAKMRAAAKRMKAAEKNGSEKQAATAEKHFKTWKNRYLRSMVALKNAKAEQPKKFTVKRALVGTGIAIGVFVVTGTYMFLKNGAVEDVTAEAAESL
jgi:hypothetical protein